MADTRFESVEQKTSPGRSVITHTIDQFTWYASGAPQKWNKWDEAWERQTLSAISFGLPHRSSTETRKDVVVVSDGLSMCNIYVLADGGESAQVQLYARKVDSYDAPKRVNLKHLFTTELDPFLYNSIPLVGGGYPKDGIRKYNMLLSGDVIVAIADVRDVNRDEETFKIELHAHNQTPKLLVGLKHGKGWVPAGLEDKIRK